MNMTPYDIRQKTFEKNFRGYDTDEVSAYLKNLADEFENLIEEKKDLQRKLEQSEKEGAKLKQVEESLFKTLKTAEDTGASIIEEANQAADHILRDAHENAEGMFNDARSQSRNLVESAESRGKEIIENLKTDVTAMVSSYESLIQQRELVLKTLKKLSDDINDNITVSQNDFKKVKIQAHAALVEELSKNNFLSAEKAGDIHPQEATSQAVETESKEEVIEEEINEKAVNEAETPGQEVEKSTENPERVENFKSLQSKAQEALQNFGHKEPVTKDPAPAPKQPAVKKNNQDGSFFDQLD